MKTIKYILGAGLSGLIWCFYNGGTILTKDFGGQSFSEFQLGPRLLRKTEFTKKLLTDLNIKKVEKKIKIGYNDGTGLYGEIPNKNFLKDYYKKSRNEDEVYDEKTIMNNSENEFIAYDIDFKYLTECLIEELKDNIKIVNIKKIDTKNKIIICPGEDFEYEHLISTIPLNIFCSLASIKINLKSSSVTYIYSEKEDEEEKLIGDFDFVYNTSKVYDFYRVTKINNKRVFELLGEYSKEECKEFLKEKYINSIVLKDSQVITCDNIPKIKDVLFLGKYGSWNRKWRVNNIAEFAIKNTLESAKK